MKPKLTVFAVFVVVAVGVVACQKKPSPPSETATKAASLNLSDSEISDGYVYLLGRLLVTRQEQIDFYDGFRWSQLVHRDPGGVDWPNPNLDVAYSEAWLAIDEHRYVVVTVPEIKGRYYTVQVLNGWGETVANINERTQPDRPAGDFAVCLVGSTPDLPADAVRVDIPTKFARVLIRVELGADREKAIALQHQFQMRSMGAPFVVEPPRTLMFDLDKLPGADAFDSAELALDSEKDINPGMDSLQTNVRAIAVAVRDSTERARVDGVIRQKTMADLVKAADIIGHGTVRDGWVRPSTAGVYGDDFLTRTLINHVGIWANTFDEVVYYKCALDGSGAALHSDNNYTMTFSKNQLPANFATYFWSVIAVDNVNFRVLPNTQNRFLINKQSKLRYGSDGSLTLYFAAEKPAAAPDGNWLPTPKGQGYRLTFRFYGPRGGVADGSYYPPPLIRVN